MFNTQDILNDLNNYKQQKAKRNIESFIGHLRNNYMKDPEGTAKIYSRDKHLAPFKLFKMGKGDYAIIDGDNNILFRHDDVHVCKVEFVVMLTPHMGGMASDIMSKATGL